MPTNKTDLTREQTEQIVKQKKKRDASLAAQDYAEQNSKASNSKTPNSKTSNSKELTTTDSNQKPAKKHRNRPDLANFGAELVEPGDNARYLRYAMASLNLPPIDISDEKQVEQRIYDYFRFCIQNDRKPNMVGMANWLGVGHDTLNSWKRGEYRADTHSAVVTKAIGMLEELWVDYMQNGKANPASLIFLGKNMFGYRDVQDVVVTPNQPLGETIPADTIAERYKELPGE